jgi:perosamine synthetase
MHLAAKHIPITRPDLGGREKELMLRPLESGWLVQGPYVQQFEQAFCRFTGASHALAVSSCTTALHLILHALGIGPGDEVIVPSFTFIASANAVEYTGARPVLCDIDLATFNIDVEQAQKLITSRTKAIIAVSLFGLSADMEAVSHLARDHKLAVIEDAACALGASQNRVHAGLNCTAAAFSFHPRKSITTGEGGMVTTSDPGLAALIAKLRNHGGEATDLERHISGGGSLLPAYNLLGFNYRMTDMQGALGVAQMERAHEILESRRAVAEVYTRLLSSQETVRPPETPPNFEHAWQSYVVLYTEGLQASLDNLEQLNMHRNRIMAAMEKSGITVRQGTHAVHALGYYASKYGYQPTDLPNSLIADRLSIALPLYGGMESGDQRLVVRMLSQAERLRQ